MENISKEHASNLTAGSKTIVIAGATGDLGHRISAYLIESGATVRALVREGNTPLISLLKKQGAQVIEVDFNNHTQLTKACSGASCIVSALSGLHDVMVDLQTKLLHAAVEAGVPRFIPSDFCIDYTQLPYGSNRNLDLRREFSEHLNKAPIAACSVLNGMFMDLLTGQAPIILPAIKRVMYWGDSEQTLDFTTIENTAKFTACAALDSDTPRYLRIAGEVANIKGLQRAASEATGKKFGRLRLGGLGAFKTMIKITRKLSPQKDEVFPAWQGMQYLHNMFTGLPKLVLLDNNRYPGLQWTKIRDVLSGAVK